MSERRTGRAVNGVPVCVYTLRDASGLAAEISNVGAAVLSLLVPCQGGGYDDILLGQDEPESRLIRWGPMFGVTLGRCAGRIRHGIYHHGGETVVLSPNKMGHHCHGGFLGMDKRLFVCDSYSEDSVTLSYESLDRDEGYPGCLKVSVTFTLKNKALEIRYCAQSDRDTPVSLSNHLYFNLSGHSSGELAGHRMQLHSDRIVHLDGEMVPDGGTVGVAGTVFDFQTPAPLLKDGTHEQMHHTGYFDHTYLLSEEQGKAATVWDDASGRTLTLYTDMPAVHFYVNNFANAPCTGKAGTIYAGKCAFCLQPLYPANAVNLPVFPSPMLRAGERYEHKTKFSFTW